MLTCYNCKKPLTIETAYLGKPYCSQQCEDAHYYKQNPLFNGNPVFSHQDVEKALEDNGDKPNISQIKC